MKKNYFYLLVLASMAFASCTKLPDVTPNRNLNANGQGPASVAQTFSYSLIGSDYTLLPSTVYASKQLSFLSTSDANQYIPSILASKYPTYANGSKATVTYSIGSPAVTPPSLKLADSVYNTTALVGPPAQPTGLEYTLANPTDYTALLVNGLANKNIDFSVAQVLSWLNQNTKYPTPLPNQLEVLTWIFYPTIPVTSPQIFPGISLSTSSTTPAVTTAVGSFLYLNGAWIQAYQITPAQYAAVGAGQYNQFQTSNSSSILSYINGILKADASVTAAATIGSIKYVSFNYYNSSGSPAVTSQRVIPVVFDGNNWGRATVTPPTTTASALFTKTNGVWMGDPTVYHTLNATDETLISNSTVGGTALATYRGYVSKYGDFDVGTNQWTIALIDQAFILVLQADYPTPTANVPYIITYNVYTNSVDVPTNASFTWNGTAWIAAQ